MNKFYYLVIGLVIMFIVIKVYRYYKNKRDKSNIYETLKSSLFELGLNNPLMENKKVYDYLLETDDVVYLFKVFMIPKDGSVVITNKTTWILGSKSKGEDLRNIIPGVRTFVNYHYLTDKSIKKIALIYPNARNVLKYINESEMIVVTPKTDVYGVKIILFNELKGNLVMVL